MMNTRDLPPPFGTGGQASPTVTTPSGAAPARPTVQVIHAGPKTETAQKVAAVAAPSSAALSSTEDAAKPAAPVHTASLGSGHYVQMRAGTDEKRAQTEVGELSDKYSAVLGSVPVSSKAVDLGDKGVWFRLLAGPLPTKDAATDLCTKLKGAGLPNCIIRSE
jgi:cell division protein FtsN